MLWRLEPSCLVPDITCSLLEKVEGATLQPTAPRVPSTLLIFQKRLTTDASPGPNSHHTHTPPFPHERYQEGAALQSRSPAQGPHSSPSPTKAHLLLNMCPRSTKRATGPVSSARTAAAHSALGRNLPASTPSLGHNDNQQKTALRASKAPAGDCARGGRARVHTGPGPAPWRRGASLTTGADSARACGTASVWGPGVGEATSGREDTPPRSPTSG